MIPKNCMHCFFGDQPDASYFCLKHFISVCNVNSCADWKLPIKYLLRYEVEESGDYDQYWMNDERIKFLQTASMDALEYRMVFFTEEWKNDKEAMWATQMLSLLRKKINESVRLTN